jgi:hypothetical protein
MTVHDTLDAALERLPSDRPARNQRCITLDLERMAHMGMVTHEGGRTPAAEDFRIIKRPLLRNLRSDSTPAIRNGNLIVVTSALPGEGKTYCAINLAMSIAMERDITVLLVDADVARPSVLKVLGLGAEAGLMDILLNDELELADVILKTNVPTLSILPAGRSNRHATELLASRSMSTLLSEIANRYAHGSERAGGADGPGGHGGGGGNHHPERGAGSAAPARLVQACQSDLQQDQGFSWHRILWLLRIGSPNAPSQRTKRPWCCTWSTGCRRTAATTACSSCCARCRPGATATWC